MADILTFENLAALATLTAMEIVLGIDNIVFIAILTSRVEAAKQGFVRIIGLGLAMVMRIALLFAISWIMSLEASLFSISGRGFSGKDLILLAGGLFLIAKATKEIHHKIENGSESAQQAPAAIASVRSAIAQIVMIDIVFSLDSVITAVGMAKELWVMVTAVVIAVAVMMIFAGRISRFIDRHPTMKMLALSFLLLIGVMLVADGLGEHIPRGYIYFAMAFSLGVEVLNMRAGLRRQREAAGA
jgi:predicted tellurium resistance membrane protein TerC